MYLYKEDVMDDYDKQTDGEMIRLTLAEERKASDTLIGAYRPRIYAFYLGFLGNSQDADDATQKILEYRQRTRNHAQAYYFHEWIRSALNICIDIRRHREQKEATVHVDPQWREPKPSPEKALWLRRRRQSVKDALNQLPDKHQSVLLLRYEHELTLAEIAWHMNISVRTVSRQLSNAKRHLVEVLHELE